jgi:hypothetical protein
MAVEMHSKLGNQAAYHSSRSMKRVIGLGMLPTKELNAKVRMIFLIKQLESQGGADDRKGGCPPLGSRGCRDEESIGSS